MAKTQKSLKEKLVDAPHDGENSTLKKLRLSQRSNRSANPISSSEQ